jgi:hypothetical protein
MYASSISISGSVDITGDFDTTGSISSDSTVTASTGMFAGGVIYVNGNESTDNSWRIAYDTGNTNLVIQKRVAGSWTTKSTIT